MVDAPPRTPCMEPRTHGERRKAAILAAGVKLWAAGGSADAVSARAIGKALGISHSACLYHFGSTARLRDAVAREAVRLCDLTVVAVLIATKHPAAAALSSAERRRFQLGIR